MLKFNTRTFGKWILTGEHAVIRGHAALVFPIKSKHLDLCYLPSEKKLTIKCSPESQQLFEAAFARALKIAAISAQNITGEITVTSNIPMRAGMGSSAALSVAIMRLLQYLDLCSETKLFEFSRELEDMFHGESSGVDIAVAIAGVGICFSHQGTIGQIKQSWQPLWFLSYSNMASATSASIAKVKTLWDNNPTLAQQIDEQMATSVQLAETALQNPAPQGLENLKDAIELGYNCFKQWQLCEGQIEEHIQTLHKAGALAAKPTGAGGGGYILSLWDQQPPQFLQDALIPL